MNDTIYALSSGAPPAAIGVIRISGPQAGNALERLAGGRPEPRRASLRTLRADDGRILDQALVLWFDGANTATGEDLAELHCHGGIAIIRAVQHALSAIDGLRPALPGEFTRRAFENGRLDLSEAEGLADLLAAETELQRLAAQNSFGGRLSELVEGWRVRVIALSARLEALMDFGDEDDVAVDVSQIERDAASLREDLAAVLANPPVERLRDGIRVVLAGPPNAGKSSLFNALLQEDAAIVSDIRGTTRDVIERSIAIDGVPIVLVDTAGVHEASADEIEKIGIGRSLGEFEKADIVLWLGGEGEGPQGSWEIEAMADLDGSTKSNADHSVSAVTGFGLAELLSAIAVAARSLLPKPNAAALNERQRFHASEALACLSIDQKAPDPLILAEQLRQARAAFDAISGRSSTEEMLDAVFGQFCIGK